MYHNDQNINVALERMADRVRAVRSIGQTPASAVDERAWLNDDEASAPRLPSLRRWLPVAAGFVVLLGLLVFAWSVAAAP